MSDSRLRDVSFTRRSRSSRAVSPVVSFADRQMDAQARSALDRAETAAARQGIAHSEDELSDCGEKLITTDNNH